jgi:hypothetical protein
MGSKSFQHGYSYIFLLNIKVKLEPIVGTDYKYNNLMD